MPGFFFGIALALASLKRSPRTEPDTSLENLIHVGLAARRNYLSTGDADKPGSIELYLPGKKELVLDIQPANGQSKRDPQEFVVKVLDQERWQIRAIAMRATQPLLLTQ